MKKKLPGSGSFFLLVCLGMWSLNLRRNLDTPHQDGNFSNNGVG
jgi:hypothetical protein